MPTSTITKYPAPTTAERELAKDLICEIIAAEGGTFYSKTRLFKAFYYAHIVYYQKFEGLLSTYPIVHMPNGPGIDKHKELFEELERECRITSTRNEFETSAGDSVVEYTFSLSSPVPFNQETPRGQAICAALECIHGKSPSELSLQTHEKSWSWQETENGQEQNIYLDILSREEYLKIKRRLAVTENMIEEMLHAG